MKKLLLLASMLAWGPVCHAETGSAPIRVSNEPTGVSVEVPPGWTPLTDEMAEASFECTVVKKEFRDLVESNHRAPLLAYTKYREPYEDLNPNFQISTDESGEGEGHSAVQMFTIGVRQMLKVIDARLVGRVRATKLGGLPAVYARIQSVKACRGKKFAIVAEMWLVPRQGYHFLIAAESRLDEANGTRAELARIIGSIRFDLSKGSLGTVPLIIDQGSR